MEGQGLATGILEDLHQRELDRRASGAGLRDSLKGVWRALGARRGVGIVA